MYAAAEEQRNRYVENGVLKRYERDRRYRSAWIREGKTLMTSRQNVINDTTACRLCRHFSGVHRGRPTCQAFPEGIPQDILEERVKHTDPYAGDRGIRFAPRFDGARERYDRAYVEAGQAHAEEESWRRREAVRLSPDEVKEFNWLVERSADLANHPQGANWQEEAEAVIRRLEAWQDRDPEDAKPLEFPLVALRAQLTIQREKQEKKRTGAGD